MANQKRLKPYQNQGSAFQFRNTMKSGSSGSSPAIIHFRRVNTLGVLRGTASLREQSARPNLNEQDQSDKHENLREYGAGVRLQQIVDDAHRHTADESAPEIPDTAKDNDH